MEEDEKQNTEDSKQKAEDRREKKEERRKKKEKRRKEKERRKKKKKQNKNKKKKESKKKKQKKKNKKKKKKSTSNAELRLCMRRRSLSLLSRRRWLRSRADVAHFFFLLGTAATSFCLLLRAAAARDPFAGLMLTSLELPEASLVTIRRPVAMFPIALIRLGISFYLTVKRSKTAKVVSEYVQSVKRAQRFFAITYFSSCNNS